MEESCVEIKEVPAKIPPLWFLHFTAIGINIIFGIGNCIGKEALKSMPPIIFAFYREMFAGLILLIICFALKKAYVHKEDIPRLLLVGLCMFGNQVFFIVGLSFAPAHVASIWQPSQPIFTVILTILLKMEPKSWKKIVGIILATSGSLMVAILSGGGMEGKNIFIGSCFFFVNCLSNSLFVIVSKPLVKKYAAVTITSLAYCTCTVYVMIVGGVMYWDKPDSWKIPTTGIWCLIYFVFIHSITTYFLMLWCNRYIDASIISAYTTFQPVSTMIVAMIFLDEKLIIGDLGALLIFAGLAFVIYDSYDRNKKETLIKDEYKEEIVV